MAVEHAGTNNLSSASNSSGSVDSPPWESTEAGKGVQIVVTLFIFLVGVPLNGLVIWALGWRYKGRMARRGSGEENRSANNFRVYVLNLSVADLLLVLRTPLMIGFIANNNSWPFGSGMCRLTMFLRVFGLYASAFLLCAVAFERCMCLLRPVWSRLRRPVWAVPLTCGLLWVVATALSAPYLHFAIVYKHPVLGNLLCIPSDNIKTIKGLFVTESIAGFFLPLVVFLASNTAILLTARQAGATVQNMPNSPPATARRMVRLYQVLFFTMLLFCTCWVPYFVIRFLESLLKDISKELKGRLQRGSYISLYLVYIKSALNPVLYVFAGRGLGRTVRASVVSTIGRVFNEDSAGSIRRKSLAANNSQI